jgi:hypothetical protein
MICSNPGALRREIKAGSVFRPGGKHSALRCVISTSWDDMDAAAWKGISQRGSVFLDPGYLTALAGTLPPGDRLWFCIFNRGAETAGIAVFHLTSFEADSVSSNLDECAFTGLIRKSLTRNRHTARVLISGNAFATGEHGFLFRPDVRTAEATDAICYAITDIIRSEQRSGDRISAVLAKDFYPRSTAVVKGLRKCGFRDFEVDPGMILPVDRAWKSFDDYLDALNTKFRTKAKAALKRSEALEIRDIDGDALARRISEFYELYRQVLNRAEHRLGVLTPEAFILLKQQLGDRMIIRGLFLDNQLVGFLTAFDCGDRLDAHMVGIRYEFNTSHAVYQTMLYEYIRLAIAHEKKWVLFGRTAGEIKSSVGAFPVRLNCCIRHPGKISNLLLNWLFSYVRPSHFPVRDPWKKASAAILNERLREGPFCC